jgi:DegT/DnrJ/EryC1/StrS aminotransferase family
LQAAIGLHQLARVEENWQCRRELWQRYDAELAGLPITLPVAPEANTRQDYHLYTVMIDPVRCGISRDGFLDAMNAVRIGTGVQYLSVPEHPYYQQHFGWQPEQWRHAPGPPNRQPAAASGNERRRRRPRYPSRSEHLSRQLMPSSAQGHLELATASKSTSSRRRPEALFNSEAGHRRRSHETQLPLARPPAVKSRAARCIGM